MPRHKAAVKNTTRKVRTASGEVVRALPLPTYKRFKLQKRIKHPGSPLPPTWAIFKKALKHIWGNKKIFIGLTLVYLALTLVFVRGYAFTSDLPSAKEAIEELVTGAKGQVAGSVAVLGILIGTSTNLAQASSIFQSIILVVCSMALIWALRQTYVGQKVSLKDSFYRSTTPLVPFLFIVSVIGLQLLPVLVGSFLYSAAVNAGLAATLFENFLWLSFVGVMLAWSFYMLTVSLIALYIVTLPDMTPLKALRSAKELVRYRRWTVLRKILFLPVILLVLSVVVLVPIIMILTALAEVVFLLLGSLAIVLFHGYMYSLYRELL